MISNMIVTINPEFQSTPSGRRVTEGIGWLYIYYNISIHTLRAEGDCHFKW